MIVSLIVLLIVSPLVFSPCLACRAAGRRAVRVLFSRPVVGFVAWGVVLLAPARLPLVVARLVCLLVPVSVSCGDVAVGMAGRGCFASVPVARAACLAGDALRVDVALAVRLVVGLVVPMCLLGGGAWRLVLASHSPPIRISPRLPCRETGRYFLSLSAFPFFANQRGMRACSRS